MMERLTKRTVMGIVGNNASIKNYPLYKIAQYDELDHGITAQCFNKLAEYEDLEEQGLLLRLPCKVGDILYCPEECFNIVIPVRLNEIVMSFVGLDTYSFQYNCCSFDECGDVYEDYEFDLNDIGKTVFLTQEEAEQKLKEMEDKITI